MYLDSEKIKITVHLPILTQSGSLMQAGNLSDFYENCRGLELARNFQFPTLREVSVCAGC